MKNLLGKTGFKTLSRETQASINGGDGVCNEGEVMTCIFNDCWCTCPDSLDDWVIR